MDTTDLLRNGEIPDNAPSYGDALALLDRYRRMLDGQQLKVARLEAELARKEEEQPGAGQVQAVLEHHHALHMPKAKVIAGSKRWTVVKACLKNFKAWELNAASVGAMHSEWHQGARHRLDARNLFANLEGVEELRDAGLKHAPHLFPLSELFLSHPQTADAGEGYAIGPCMFCGSSAGMRGEQFYCPKGCSPEAQHSALMGWHEGAAA